MKRHDKPGQLAPRADQRTVSTTISGYSGPLPHPDILRGYDEVLPGSSERMLVAWEKESDHRRSIERNQADSAGFAIHHEVIDRRIALFMGFFIAVAGFAAATTVALYSNPTAGVVLGSLDVLGLVSVFVIGKRTPQPAIMASE